jgi:ApbE superfamily uncharacterized protein (UPF0280 family)
MERGDLHRFSVKISTSDLLILCSSSLENTARETLEEVRAQIEDYIAGHQDFASSLQPIRASKSAPEIVIKMVNAAKPWGVGPMASVAGAISEAVGKRLEKEAKTVIVENGGDVYVKAPLPIRFGLYAGEESPFTDKVEFEVDASGGLGVCTSSGRVGPSLSLGKADAVVAISEDTAFADAAATSLANQVKTEIDVERVVRSQERSGMLRGLIVCCKDKIGIWGDLKLV